MSTDSRPRSIRRVQIGRIGTALTTVLAAGQLIAPVANAADECLGTPEFGDLHARGLIPDLTDTDGTVRIFIELAGVPHPPDYCTGVTATVRKTDGSLEREVAFDDRESAGMPPAFAIVGLIPVPVSNGAGDWVVTKVTHGTETKAVSVPFRIRRGTTIGIEQPATVTSPARTTVTGIVRQFTSAGGTTAVAGRTVRVSGAGVQSGAPLHPLGTARTDANGRYRFQVAISAPVSLRAEVDPDADHGGSSSSVVTARVLAQLSPVTASDRGYVGVWWRVTGKAFPTSLVTFVEMLDGTQWNPIWFGGMAADGSFTRWWKPATAGTFRLRVELRGTGADNLPIAREVRPVTVTARPAYLTGVAGATSATVIRPGTRMSTFGHLSAMYTTGRAGAFAGQKVLVQTRPRGQTSLPYTTVATATTSNTGYYYVNWTVQKDVDVRVAFISPYTSVGSAFTYVRAVDVR